MIWDFDRVKRAFKQEKKTILLFASFLVVTVLTVLLLRNYLPAIGTGLLIFALGALVLMTWAYAGYAVMKALFWVGADLSLMIFLAQAYCDVPAASRTGDEALKSLVGFAIFYIGAHFTVVAYKEIKKRTDMFKEANDNKLPWLAVIPFGLFTGLFVWQIGQVLLPILHNLCIYKV
jgi:hypothetical protein